MQQVLSQSVHGRLYRATDEAGQPVAIKELVFAHAPDAASIEAFAREARLLETLSHPRIPRLRKAFSEGEGAHLRFYLVQDYVAGESLAARLEHHRFDEAEVRDIARQVLEVLVFLNSVQPPVVHRDIKPANLIQREDGAIVLVDFGSARALQQGRTHEATLNGTFGYMAPEQLGGSVSPASDLYSLGATLLHLLSRRPPEALLRGDGQLAVTRAVHVSKDFRAFVKRLVRPRPEDRFPNAAAALEALAQPLPRGRPRWPRMAAGAVLMVGAAALVWGRGVSAPWPPQEPPRTTESLQQKEQKPPPAPGEEQVLYSWEFEVRGNNWFNDSKVGRKLRRSEVELMQGVLGAQMRAVLLGGKGFLRLEPPEGGSSRLGTLKEGALSMWLSREQPDAGPVVTTYAGNRPVLQLRFDEEGRLLFGMGEHQVQSPQALTPGRFFHVALEWGPTGRQLWIDGERVARDATPGEALGEHLVIGWDERVPGELAPAFLMDQLRIHSGIPPLDTWPQAQRMVPEELRGAPSSTTRVLQDVRPPLRPR